MGLPGWTPPAIASYPVAANFGTAANLNGLYLQGTTPGVSGPQYPGFGATSYAVAFNGLGTDATNRFANFTNGVVNVTNVALTGIIITNVDNPLNLKTNNITAVVWFKSNPADYRFQGLIGRGNSSWRMSLDGTSGHLRWNAGGGAAAT
jgi:hypothetical protein